MSLEFPPADRPLGASVAMGGGRGSAPWGSSGPFSEGALARLGQASLTSLEAVLQWIDEAQRQGHALDTIYLQALAPCVQALGQGWCEDHLGFADVTIGSTNVQRAMQCLSPQFCAPGADHPTGFSLLLVTEPQAQHTLGAYMLSEFFRRAGWSVQFLNPQDGTELLAVLRSDWFDALGLSLSTQRHTAQMVALWPQLRAQSPNPHLCVMVGGPMAHLAATLWPDGAVDHVGGDAVETVNFVKQRVIARKS